MDPLVGAPKKYDKIYTDSHAGSRRSSSIYHWLKRKKTTNPPPAKKNESKYCEEHQRCGKVADGVLQSTIGLKEKRKPIHRH